MYSLFHGVMSASVDFVVETFSQFVWSHVSSMYMYSCRCVAAISGSGCCEKTVMSGMLAVSSTQESRGQRAASVLHKRQVSVSPYYSTWATHSLLSMFIQHLIAIPAASLICRTNINGRVRTLHTSSTDIARTFLSHKFSCLRLKKKHCCPELKV